MQNQDINLLEELDSLSQIHTLKRNDIDVIMHDFATRILPSLLIERMSVWLFNPEKTAVVSIGEYDSRTKKFNKNSVLNKKDFPIYFDALNENKIILAEDIYAHPLTKEFNDVYSKPNNIFSLLDIPFRISGELVGVICYEKTETPKKFTPDEISFCLSISFVLASTLESRKRRVLQDRLEIALHEKDLLIREINHRVKNNLTILISLMRISKSHIKNNESKVLLDEYERRIFSMLKIHDMLTENEHTLNISLSSYIKALIIEFRVTYPQINHCFKVDVIWLDYLISTKKAIHLGLIISEVLLNSIKYAATKSDNYEVFIQLSKLSENSIELKIGDNGEGFNFDTHLQNETLGLPLIKDLADSLDLKSTFPTQNNCYYNFEFEMK